MLGAKDFPMGSVTQDAGSTAPPLTESDFKEKGGSESRVCQPCIPAPIFLLDLETFCFLKLTLDLEDLS